MTSVVESGVHDLALRLPLPSVVLIKTGTSVFRSTVLASVMEQ